MIHDWRRLPGRFFHWVRHDLFHDQYNPTARYYDCITCRRLCRRYKLEPLGVLARRERLERERRERERREREAAS